uniref:Uncharacterized protein n=1 Tax=Davidia involucrata TaxID=16924 RepID=A0A5B7BWJ1_DAVIN
MDCLKRDVCPCSILGSICSTKIFFVPLRMISQSQINLNFFRLGRVEPLQALFDLPLDVAALIVKRIVHQQTYAFLTGLHTKFEFIHAQILASDPLPPLRTVYVTINSDESRHSLISPFQLLL